MLEELTRVYPLLEGVGGLQLRDHLHALVAIINCEVDPRQEGHTVLYMEQYPTLQPVMRCTNGLVGIDPGISLELQPGARRVDIDSGYIGEVLPVRSRQGNGRIVYAAGAQGARAARESVEQGVAGCARICIRGGCALHLVVGDRVVVVVGARGRAV